MLGQMAFVDNVAVLRPYIADSTNSDAKKIVPIAVPVFNGEATITFDTSTGDSTKANKLHIRYRRSSDGKVLGWDLGQGTVIT